MAYSLSDYLGGSNTSWGDLGSFGTSPGNNFGTSEAFPYPSSYKRKSLPFPTIGTDLTSGYRGVDYSQLFNSTQEPSGNFNSTSAVPDSNDVASRYIKFQKSIYPIERQRQIDAYKDAAALTNEQLASTYPYLSAAAAESTARNLAASKEFAGFKQQLPTTVQDIMASKQNQMASAAASEAERQKATAFQQQAANQFARGYAGKFVSYA